MKKSSLLFLLAGLFAIHPLFAQEDKPSQKMESSQIIIQQKGNGSESLSIQIDGDNVTVNGKPLSEYDDKNVTVKKKKMIISDGEKIIYDSDEDAKTGKNENPAQKKAFLGVTSETAEKGARIMAVTKESAADKAGLLRGDVITKINDTRIDGPESLTDAISKCKPGEQVKIKYSRDGKDKTLKTVLGEKTESSTGPKNNVRSFSFSMPDEGSRSFSFPDIEGMDINGFFKMPDISDLDIDIRKTGKSKLGLKIRDTEKGNGVKILEVEENSASARAGLIKDDVITDINGRKINNTDDAREQLKESEAGDSYKMKLIRDGKEIAVEVSIPKKLRTIDL